MKIVIQTQVRENYAAHEGFKGEYRWKYKGGNTYVVPNLTANQVLKIKDQGMPTLTSLIEERNNSFEEYILDYSFHDDDDVVCDEWETPYELFWEQGKWVARRTVENGEYGYMRRDIARKTEQYDMLMGGGRENYVASYEMRDGRILNEDELRAHYEREAA